ASSFRHRSLRPSQRRQALNQKDENGVATPQQSRRR
ncbi:MAG: hypothetical protein ACI8QS_003389, partial [Planctomycetota bacterium]